MHGEAEVRAGARRQRIVVVLGSHRSGTSAITRLLGLLGLELGPHEQLLEPIQGDNEKGFYEHRPISEVNERILRRLEGSWREPPVLADGWESNEELDDLRARGRDLIARDFDGARSWGFKDPRTSLTLSFWRRLISPTAYVICQRNPLAVAQSLLSRNQIPLEYGVALWVHYTASAIINTSGERRFFLAYEELFSERRAAVAELAAFMDVPGLARDREFQAAVDGWLDAELRHHSPSLRDVIEHPAMSPEARELCLLLEHAVHSRNSEPGLAGGRGAGAISEALDALAARLVSLGPPRGSSRISAMAR